MQKNVYVMATLIMLTACFILLFPSQANATTIVPATTAPATTTAPVTTVAPATIVTPAPPVQHTVSLWLQATDSCQEALPGASFTLVDPGGLVTIAPVTRGTVRVTIGNAEGSCPLAHGNCAQHATGCTAWHIVVPATGSVTYRIVEHATRASGNGLTFIENPTGPGGSALGGFSACTGGSACHSEFAIVTVSSSGSVTATVRNMAPDRTVQTYGPFTGKTNDPVLFHNYMVGDNYRSDPCDASKGNVQMNYGTGTESAHCRYVP